VDPTPTATSSLAAPSANLAETPPRPVDTTQTAEQSPKAAATAPAPTPSRPAAPAPGTSSTECGSYPAVVGGKAAIPTAKRVGQVIAAAAPAAVYKTNEAGPIMELADAPYATLELLGEVSDAKGPSGIQVQAVSEGAKPAQAAATAIANGKCAGRTYAQTALPDGGVLLVETTSPATEEGYEVVAWTAEGVRIRASAQTQACCLTSGPRKGAPYGNRTAPLLTVAQLRTIVTTLAAG
jgi:hypothetical protein